MTIWGQLTSEFEAAEDRVIQTLSPQIAKIRLTETMINKYNIDAKSDMKKLALIFGVNYADLKPGDRVQVNAYWTETPLSNREPEPCKMSFYRTASRGDSRFSIQGIKQHCQPGDLVSFSYELRDGETVISATAINVSAFAEIDMTNNGPIKIKL